MTKKLEILQKGEGKPLVILHGWGMNQHVWQPVKAALEENFTVYWVDLPGHGINQALSLGNIDQVSHCIANEVPDNSVFLAWSLGGLIAQNIALQFPAKVERLILTATSPSFVQRKTWEYAMKPEILQGFIESLQQDFANTLKRFLSLQFMGVKGVQTQLKVLREDLLSKPPSLQTLQDGLDILKSADFHQNFPAVSSHWILGKLDRLVPAAVADDLLKIPNASVELIDRAGHAPFISHPDAFIRSVLNAR